MIKTKLGSKELKALYQVNKPTKNFWDYTPVIIMPPDAWDNLINMLDQPPHEHQVFIDILRMARAFRIAKGND